MILWELFSTFFQTGLFSIGGGYAMIPLIQKSMVSMGWMTVQEVADIVAISQMTPGPFAVNAATFVGMRMAGVAGACFATLGVTLPSVIIVLIVARFFGQFQKKPVVQNVLYGVRPAVAGLIATAGWSIAASTFLTLDRQLDFWALGIAAVTFFAMWKLKLDPILLIALSGAAGILIYAVLPQLL